MVVYIPLLVLMDTIIFCREAVQKLKVKEVNYNTDRPPTYTDRSLTELPIESLIDRI